MQLFFFRKRSLLRSNHHRHILTHQGYYLAVVGVFFGLLGQLLANLIVQAFQLPSAEPHIGRAEEHMVLATLADYPHVVFFMFNHSVSY